MIKEKEDAELAKLAANAQTDEARKKVSELMTQLAELEKAPKSEEEWFATWQTTKACEEFVNEVGSTAQKMGVDDGLKRMKAALARSYPSFS